MVQVSHPKVAATLVDAAGDAVLTGALSVGGNRADALPAALYVSTNGVWQPVFTPSARGDGNDASYMVSNHGYLYNGTTYDKTRGNVAGTAIAGAAYTSAQSSGLLTNHNCRGIIFFVNCSAVSGAASVTYKIFGYDFLTSSYETTAMFTSAAVTTVSVTQFSMYPGNTVAAGVSSSLILPRGFKITSVHGTGDSITFSVGYQIIL